MSVPIIPNPGAAVQAGSEASIFGSYLATGTVTSATVTLAPGWWGVLTGAHNVVTQNINPSTTTITLVPASSFGYVLADGYGCVIANDSTGGTAAHYFSLLGGGP